MVSPVYESPADEGIHAPVRVDERDLVPRIRSGDEAAFETLYRAYHVPLSIYVRGFVREPAIAEELVQDVMWRVWQRRREWQPLGGIGSYLYAAARNAASNHLRHVRIADRWEANAQSAADAIPMSHQRSAQDAIEAAELAGVVARAIDALPERCREVFRLKWQQDLPVAEVARRMGIGPKSVERHWTRAIKALRERLTRRQ